MPVTTRNQYKNYVVNYGVTPNINVIEDQDKILSEVSKEMNCGLSESYKTITIGNHTRFIYDDDKLSENCKTIKKGIHTRFFYHNEK